MSESSALVFTGVSPEQFAALTAKAKATGIEMTGNSGSASQFGVEVAWKYLPEEQSLTLECLRTPFFVQPEVVYAKLSTLVRESLR
jgi:hypothetical protein